jgi:hypothetical protein
MPRKIDHKHVRFNASFGIGPEQLAKAITGLPDTARVLTIETVEQGYQAIAQITYYTQQERKPEDA